MPPRHGKPHELITMKKKKMLVCLFLSTTVVSVVAFAQEPAALQTTSGHANGAQQPAAASGQAMVYVYNAGKDHPKWGAFPVFLNGQLLGAMSGSTYASRAITPGTAVVTPRYESDAQFAESLPQTLRWPKCEGDPKKANCNWDSAVQSVAKEDRGCGKVDWQHLGEEGKEDLELCSRELNATSCALGNWLDPGRKTGGILAGLILPGALGNAAMANALSCPGNVGPWLQMCGSKPFPDPSSPEAKEEVKKIKLDLKNKDSSDDWSRCNNAVIQASAIVQSKILQAKTTLRIEVEAGKTYYVEFRQKEGDLRSVDTATGAKEVSRLHRATE